MGSVDNEGREPAPPLLKVRYLRRVLCLPDLLYLSELVYGDCMTNEQKRPCAQMSVAASILAPYVEKNEANSLRGRATLRPTFQRRMPGRH